ncbi:acyl-CoA dehydrogenase family protein [Micromonospora zamorensis]|uniref:acyl-CoA dehydrogenase family protein n=1 Tax=Micromonospora zamorensis TaxID=709883 RepID=UPI0033A72255
MPDLLTATRDVVELAAKNAADAETNRRLDPEVVRGVLEAGFARHFVPTRFGGRAATFTGLIEPVAVLGEVCVSTAWCASLTAALGRMTAYLPGEGQDEVWSGGPDALIVGALMPLGRAEPTEGGWRLSGSWPFVSIVEYSDWALVCAMVPGADRPQPWFFAVPRDTYRIADTWHTMGMRGTGSNTLILDDVFVPTGRGCSRESIASGDAVAAEAICHTVPMRAVNGLAFAVPVLGAARGAAAAWTPWVAEKLTGGPNAISALDRGAYEQTLARAHGEIDAAQLLLERVARVADAGNVAPLAVTRGSRDCALAAETLVAATDRLFTTAGTRAQAENNPLQRFWRDAHAAASHIGLQFGTAASAYAARLLAGR